jgi:hypothetical protein
MLGEVRLLVCPFAENAQWALLFPGVTNQDVESKRQQEEELERTREAERLVMEAEEKARRAEARRLREQELATKQLVCARGYVRVVCLGADLDAFSAFLWFTAFPLLFSIPTAARWCTCRTFLPVCRRTSRCVARSRGGGWHNGHRFGC